MEGSLCNARDHTMSLMSQGKLIGRNITAHRHGVSSRSNSVGDLPVNSFYLVKIKGATITILCLRTESVIRGGEVIHSGMTLVTMPPDLLEDRDFVTEPRTTGVGLVGG
jgi:hypothetical protein